MGVRQRRIVYIEESWNVVSFQRTGACVDRRSVRQMSFNHSDGFNAYGVCLHIGAIAVSCGYLVASGGSFYYRH